MRSHALNPGTGPRSVCINQPEWYIKFYITILIRRRLGLCRTGASGPSKPGWSIRRRAFMATRLALVSDRVQTDAAGQVVLKLKTPWRDGSMHLVQSPLKFMQQLVALA